MTGQGDEAREQIARWLYHNTGAREDLLDGMADDLIAAVPAVAEALAAAETVRRVEALFSGGPDTPCRTTWPDNGEGDRIECVEVPIDDLRRALDGEP